MVGGIHSAGVTEVEAVMSEGKIMDVVALKRATSKLTILKKPPLLSQGVNERFV